MDLTQLPDYPDPAPDFTPQQLKISLGQLGLLSDELRYLEDQSFEYTDKPKAYDKLARIFLNYYLSAASEVYDRYWSNIQDAIADNNMPMKQKLALKAFCWAFPRYSKCRGQSFDIVKETWEELEPQPDEMEIEPPTRTGGKKRRMKTKKNRSHKKRKSHKKHRKGKSRRH